jgi:uncharacterized repeat protein (TIGR01451 family)
MPYRMRTRLSAAALAAMALSIAASTVALAATVTNGGFESGTLSGWTVVNQAGSQGTWSNYTGTTSPTSSHTIPAPPEGTRAAITDQTGPSSHELYQDITLEPGFTHTLTFSLYYHSYAALTAPGTLDYTSAGANQQYRVDVMKTSAADFSIAPADVLANIFQTKLGDPQVVAPTTMTFDLTPFAGQTIRLRFAAAVRQFFLNAGVDNVKVVSVGADVALSGTASPEPVATGSTLTYVLTAKNNGPDPAASAVLTQTLPAGTGFVSASSTVGTCTTPAVGASGNISCALGTLANGATATLTIKVTVTAAAGASLSSAANVTSATSDPTPGNNAATLASTVIAAPVVPALPAAGAGPSASQTPGMGGVLLLLVGLPLGGALTRRIGRRP